MPDPQDQPQRPGQRQREVQRQLRAAVVTQDAVALVTQLQNRPWPEHALQLIGDGLLTALRRAQRRDGGSGDAGARELAVACLAALRARDWDGDEELAAALTAGLGAGPTPLLKPLPVDLEELAAVLEGDPVAGDGRIDLHSGDVWPGSAIDYAIEVGDEDEDDVEDRERWLWIPNHGSRAGYRDMEAFTATIDDPDIAEQLTKALDGRGAVRRFKNQLGRWPQLEARWYPYSADRHRGRARAWLAAEGYTPTPTTPGQGPSIPT